MSLLNIFFNLLITIYSLDAFLKDHKSIDICSLFNSKKIYVEYGTSGELVANFKNQLKSGLEQCSVTLITCPSCVLEVKFKYLNISRSCGKSPHYARCGCEYVQLHEPPFETSREQYCGKFIQNNVTELSYHSKTRFVNVDFVFLGHDYGHGFTLEFSANRNQIVFESYPTARKPNNFNQTLTSPFFPSLYPSDFSAEYAIDCHSEQPCQISLIFTDFLVADSSILEFFDFNGQRLYVISGNIFRPPIIKTSGPSLIMRFYANGDSDLGFRAIYSFNLGDDAEETMMMPNIDCGGQVNNLGGGITMMEMVNVGTKFYDCIWIVKTPSNFLHRKTHLYVKVVNFTDFAGRTELILRHGITSQNPIVETLKYPLIKTLKEKEHIVPIQDGFYISLKGHFRAQSKVAIVYTAFNYKDCFSGLDFLCQNSRCISALLNCDGFDNCGDNSDESEECSHDPKDRREFSKIPNFLFPKTTPYADLTAATFIFLLCTFGLVGIIFAMALLLYRVNVRARHQRQIQDHIDTIHAILEEGVSDVEEEIIIPDEPPDYEPPPEYSDVLKYLKRMTNCGRILKKISPTNSESGEPSMNPGCSRSCQTSPVRMPESPPPDYESGNKVPFCFDISDVHDGSGPSGILSSRGVHQYPADEKISCFPTKMFIDLGTSLRENIRKCKSTIFTQKHPGAVAKSVSLSDESCVKYFSDTELNNYRNKARGIKRRSFSMDDLLGRRT